MADANVPIRPQRNMGRTNAFRETTGGLLMSVIHSLTTSRNSADREHERAELEAGFARCDARLGELVASNSRNLYKVMTVFTQVLDNLARSKESLLEIREKLNSSQKLLHCKRDELKKLWLELIENRAVLAVLEQIEAIVQLPREVDEFASKRHFLHAAQCCVDGLRQLEPGSPSKQNASSLKGQGALARVEALSEVRNELLSRKESLFELAIDELHKHLYVINSAEIRGNYLASLKTRLEPAVDGQQSTINNSSLLNIFNESRSRKTSTIDSVVGNVSKTCSDYPEEDSRQYVSMLTKCLGLLDKISEAVDAIRERFENEFIYIVIKTVQDVHQTFQLDKQAGSVHQMAKYRKAMIQAEPGSRPLGLDETLDNIVHNASLPGSNDHELQLNALLSESAGQIRTLCPHQLVVLSCCTLIGHTYNGYSHVMLAGSQPSSGPTMLVNNSDLGRVEALSRMKLPRNSLKLKEFFYLLLLQYRSVVALHESIVLHNLKRIQSGLHSLEPNTVKAVPFYTANELWSKVQALLQQLLQFFLDSAGAPGMASTTPVVANNPPAHNFSNLFHGNLHNFFHAGPLFNSSNKTLRGGAAGQPPASVVVKDYSPFFPKRRQLVAGAMNAMGAMTKTTMNAMTSNLNASGGAGGPNANPNATTASEDGFDKSNQASDDTSPLNESGQHETSQQQSSSHSQQQQQQQQQSSNFSWSSGPTSLYRNAGSAGAQLFSFEHSAQAQLWNAFLNEQHQKQLLDASCDKKEEDDGQISQQHRQSGKMGKGRKRAPAIKKLFESLKSIAMPSIDNLVLIYALLFRYGLEEPSESDLLASARSNVAVSTLSMLVHRKPAKMDKLKNNALYAYLMACMHKFLLNIQLQLERMLESAKESLWLGTTVLLADCVQDKHGLAHCSSHKQAEGDEQQQQQQQQQQALGGEQASKACKEDICVIPLLESVVLIDVSLHELFALIQVMPDYSCEFLNHICNVLTIFKESASQAYTNITSQLSYGSPGLVSNASLYDLRAGQASELGANNLERKRFISANWARDQDICRLLKSLPNWMLLQENRTQNHFLATNFSHKHNLRAFSFEESPEEIRLRNVRETEILAKNLSNEIAPNELLWQDGQLRAIAHMQESFEWLALRLDDLINSIMLGQANSDDEDNEQDLRGSEVCLATITQLMKDFTELSETCLLMLHLEVRVHCFYHLRELNFTFLNAAAPQLDGQMVAEARSVCSRAGQKNLANGYELYCDDIKILPLINDLRKMHDELSAAELHPFKMTYVFEGLGHLISTIFINSVARVKRVKPIGVKRACRAIFDIQRRLTSITKNRELALDYAREYFELLLMTPEEVIASIIERTPQFSHAEYVVAITLLYQSQPAANILLGQMSLDEVNRVNEVEMQKHLKRLEEILSEMPVNI